LVAFVGPKLAQHKEQEQEHQSSTAEQEHQSSTAEQVNQATSGSSSSSSAAPAPAPIVTSVLEVDTAGKRDISGFYTVDGDNTNTGPYAGMHDQSID
jgi:protein-disulfide isomerase